MPKIEDMSPAQRAAWTANTSKWKDPEAARAAQRKGQETIQKRKVMQRLTANKQEFLDEAIDELHRNNPDFIEDILIALAKKAAGDGKDAIQAAGLLLDYTGIRAPKKVQSEVTVAQPSIEETTNELKRLGVNIIVDNNVDEDDE